MEAGSDDAAKVGESSGGPAKPKRQMKTPFQLETLEKSFAMEAYPSEATRAELSEKLGLSDRQLQMWFCHRRLKEKNSIPNKKPQKSGAVSITPEYAREPSVPRPNPGSDYVSGSGSGSGSSPYASRELQRVDFRRDEDDVGVGVGRRRCESPRTIMVLRAITCVEAQLGEPLREDGPILGMEFDPLPPDAFGAPIGSMEELRHSDHLYDNNVYDRRDVLPGKATGRSLHEYQFLQDQPSTRYNAYGQGPQDHFHDVPIDGPSARTPVHGSEKLSGVHGVQGHALHVCRVSSEDRERPGDDDFSHRDAHASIRSSTAQMGGQVLGVDNAYPVIDGKVFHNESAVHVERKRKNDEARSAREIEAHESRMRKALEKENILRRKDEERMKKEMEKYDRERRKEEERLKREQQKEEERLLREQKREIERREKFIQKEYIRAEKMRQKEEQRQEKEAERRKVALERATARKIAKESMELMDDEQLELMELAATEKGLPSIVNLDHNTLQNLDMFRDSLCAFPSRTVQLKRPFAIRPWSNSEGNIGNLFMAWRFLITFADVLGLWPFTLDEFVQAFHDYDSRLLGEIHIALLKLIIKDIEDVARTLATGPGMHQNGGANPEGGHPHIVEGAYGWGFDIRKWQKHLNPLTWPEIFRQLALSAGFVPQLKKSSALRPLLQEGDEVKDCKDILSTLRSGSAAAKALSIMRDKGLLLPRRSRHRLTPGTVKFAAFHVLSLEGGKGLTVLDLADKIQKSGLRDLRTSKTPEASISVALTRDTKLFERIAPSTYRVRSAYRKDPADAEAILSEARKKIRMFENGLPTGEDVDEMERDDDVERDDVERDDDGERDEVSEGDDDEDPDVDDFATPSSAIQEADQYEQQMNDLPVVKEEILADDGQSLLDEAERDFTVGRESDIKNDHSATVPNQYVEHIDDAKIDQESMEIDESILYESWVRGLTEGEYSHLSVEERLTAFVALIGIANEGNSIRTVLEDRLEAASALKKQMLAEVQLDKSRIKDDFISIVEFSSFVGGKTEAQVASLCVGGSQSASPAAAHRSKEASPIHGNHEVLAGPEGAHIDVSDMPTERSLAAHEPSGVPDNSSHGYVSRKSRSQLKTYIAQRAEEIYIYRSLPLGQDRRRNRYWQFVTSASRNDPGSGRIFVEFSDGSWRIIDSEEAFDALLISLDTRGIREAHLRVMLRRVETLFKSSVKRSLQSSSASQSRPSVKNEVAEMDSSPDSLGFGSPTSTVYGTRNDTETSSSIKTEVGRNEYEKKAATRRYSDFQKWVWTECYNSFSLSALRVGIKRSHPLLDLCDECLTTYFHEETHCHSCHETFNHNFDFAHHSSVCNGKAKSDIKDYRIFKASLPLGIRLVKALLAYIEVSIPLEALESLWIANLRKMWGMKLNGSQSTEELLQMLTVLESAVKREYLSSEFETTKELLRLAGSFVREFANMEHVSVLPWIPQTTSAVTLRLLELDGSIAYVKQEEPDTYDDKPHGESLSPLLRPASLTIRGGESTHLQQDDVYLKEHIAEVSNGRKTNKRGGGRSGGERKRRRKASGSKSDGGKRNFRCHDNLSNGLGRTQQGYSRGPRTVRKRRTETITREPLLAHTPDRVRSRIMGGESSRGFSESWRRNPRHIEEAAAAAAADSDSAEEEAAESDEDVGFRYDDGGNWEGGSEGPSSNGWNKDPMEASEEEAEVSEDEEEDNEVDDAGEEDFGDGGINMGTRDAEFGQLENDDDEGSESAVSEDYSD